MSTSPPYSDFDPTTVTRPLSQVEQVGKAVLLLTVIWHPDLRRVGEQFVLPEPGRWQRVSRFEPHFASIAGLSSQPLIHSGVSRAAVLLNADVDGGVTLCLEDERVPAELNGHAMRRQQSLSAADLASGAVLRLGGRVVLCLHRSELLPVTSEPSLLGVSSGMERLRRQVRLVAATPMPVLVLGESGTGKELVAQAVHRHSRRADRPFVSVNMATLNENLAAAELFGAARGAYTGAQTARQGLWAEAEGGTLFLDEIGDTPALVQPMLLRVIETSEYRSVGGSRAQPCDVRLVAATDRKLDAERFNQPLLRRLQTFVMRTPALRERREDLGVLARHWLAPHGEPAEWLAELPSSLVRAICLHDWPGNVRQLAQAMTRLALVGPSGEWPSVEELLGEPLSFPGECVVLLAGERPVDAFLRGSPSPVAEQGSSASLVPDEVAQQSAQQALSTPTQLELGRRTWKSTASVSPEALFAALDEHGWQLKETARALGVSRPSLYNLLARQPDLRPAEHWQAEQLLPWLAQPGMTLVALARELRCPKEALRRRLRALGLPRLPDGSGRA